MASSTIATDDLTLAFEALEVGNISVPTTNTTLNDFNKFLERVLSFIPQLHRTEPLFHETLKHSTDIIYFALSADINHRSAFQGFQKFQTFIPRECFNRIMIKVPMKGPVLSSWDDNENE